MNKLLEKPNICSRCSTTCIEKEEKVIICSDVDFRCKNCGKLLAKENSNGDIAANIKCPKCGEMNER